ncbi:MAG: Asp-tRNA(Asn)/Glu-tRNA(Gln) amidotransferase GatCAB subunit B [Candidatus Aenigmatarchaeota archaeon]|nr:MAG: Asp-tRNA(Asn)/Glu-tRNA(Gln) amidotransferase GatCAB subunit B [Candidatus Aenigmarchaeota archaeon]
MDLKIGLETHAQLGSETKLFCGCRNPVMLEKEPEPNTLVCPVCLGHPGSKPMVNQKVIEIAKSVAVALNCEIAEEMFFSRKTYFYPDMSKNFQITQYEIPVAKGGFVWIDVKGEKKKIRLRRIHIEEDPAKLIHTGGIGGKYVLVDYNRSGVPLLEIVTEPDLKSPEEARVFLQKLSLILEYLGAYMPGKSIIKSDANVSLQGGARVEIKNITGTKEIEQALKYEIVRQNNLLKKGLKIEQETRMWNPDLQATQSMRKKETEEDYGYIFEPDLTVITISIGIEEIKKKIPELPDRKYNRFIKEYGLSEKLAESLVSDPETAELFEDIARKISPRIAAGWIAGYLKKTLNWHGIRFKESGLKKEWIEELLSFFTEGRITDRNGEIAIRKMVEEKRGAKEIIEKYGLWKESETNAKKIIQTVLERNSKAVEDYRKGNEKALHFLVGLCMRETKGKIDANEIRKEIIKLIG